MKTSFTEFKRVIGEKPRLAKAGLPRRSAAKAGEQHFSVIGKWLKTAAAKKFDEDLAGIKY